MLTSAFLEFHPERIKSPYIIIGLIVIFIGISLLCFSSNIAQKIFKDKFTEEKTIIMKFISLAIVTIGCLIAVLKI